VVADQASPSGWRFRSSYQAAISAYQRAFTLQPSVLSGFRANAYQSLRALLMTSTRAMQRGRASGSDGQVFTGRPVLAGDSLLLLPHPMEVARSRVGPWNPQAVQAAVTRQREVFRDIAAAWVMEFPQSAAAMQALGISLEMLGNPAAIDTLRHARTLAVTAEDRVTAAAAELWIQVKLGAPQDPARLRRAKSLADSILSGGPSTSVESQTLAGVAALTGRANLAAALLRRNDGPSRGLPRSLQAAPALLVYASLGGPVDSLRSIERSVLDGLPGSSPPPRDDQILGWLGRAAALAAPAVTLESIQLMRGKGDYLVDVVAAWAAGDTAAVRAFLTELRASRQYPDRPIDAAYPEAVLFTWLRDDQGAIAWLDATLTTLTQAAPGTFNDPARPGALVNAMALRADLAHRTGDRLGARRWAEAVVILWSDADDFLQPLVGRMRALAK
jgi:hypothetical protein